MRFTARRPIRLPRDQYVGLQTYFVTICVENRVPIFKDPQRCNIAIDALKALSRSMHFRAHAYCFMPDHAHFLLEGRTPDSDLVKFVTRWKQSTAFVFRKDSPSRFWQRRFHDHVVRRESDCEASPGISG